MQSERGVGKSHVTHLQQKSISRATASFKKQYAEIRGCSLVKAQEQTDAWKAVSSSVRRCYIMNAEIKGYRRIGRIS
jgi:hypothetical protein